MSELVGWFVAIVFGSCLIVQAWEIHELRAKVSVAYTSGVAEGARQQALKPCTWRDTFR